MSNSQSTDGKRETGDYYLRRYAGALGSSSGGHAALPGGREMRAKPAEAAYQEAIRLQPDEWASQYNLANLYAGDGRMHDAILKYQRVLQIDPKCAKAWLSLGLALFEESRYQEAE